MRLLFLFIIISATGLVGPDSQQAAGDDSNSNESVFQFYQFPGHPSLTHLCQERVYSSSGHEITWDAFASPARPSKLVAYYQQKLGNTGFTREREGGFWRMPADAPQPKRVLEVRGIGTNNPSRNCEKRPPSNSRAIVILSRVWKR